MAWPLPTPDAIADQASTDLEEGLRTAPDGSLRTIDARSPRSVLAVIARVIGLALYPVYLFFGWILRQALPDTADDADWLGVHARTWGIDRGGAAAAVGSVTFSGAEDTVIPAGTRLTLSGASWTTDAEATIGAEGVVAVAVTASGPGTIGNSAAGAALAVESPILGLAAQTATVGAGGLAGGIDVEAVADWRQRLIDHIRERPHGGAAVDYGVWLRAALAGSLRWVVHRNWIGAGTVGVVFAVRGTDGLWRAPTTGELAAATAALETAAPVTATVVVLAAEITAIDVTVAIAPWSTATESAVRAAVRAWFASADMQVATTLRVSRLRERISRAAGETWHELTLPAGEEIALTARQFPVLGNLVVTEASS